MEARAVGQRRIDERLAQVDAAPGRVEHALDEVADGGIRQRQRHALRHAAPRDEDAVGRVDPHFLG